MNISMIIEFFSIYMLFMASFIALSYNKTNIYSYIATILTILIGFTVIYISISTIFIAIFKKKLRYRLAVVFIFLIVCILFDFIFYNIFMNMFHLSNTKNLLLVLSIGAFVFSLFLFRSTKRRIVK